MDIGLSSQCKKPALSRPPSHRLGWQRIEVRLLLSGSGVKRLWHFTPGTLAYRAHCSPPLHVCEVVVRNAVADALELIHGPSWPWSSGFERSLPRCAGPGYNPLTDLQRLKSKRSTAGQIVTELKFVFWEKMFTSRHDDRIWNSCLIQVFPNLEPANTTAENRKKIFENLNNVRLLRNRIVHHEPIFSRDLQADFCIIIGLVEARCRATASWMLKQQHALEVIATKPF